MDTGTILIKMFWFFITMSMDSVQGKKPNCVGTEEPNTELFSKDHYDEIGFVRDTCVELARNLHDVLNMLNPTGPCKNLANIRTSTFWPFCKWNRWTREGNKTVSDQVMDKALAMMKDFNENPLYKTYSVADADQEPMKISEFSSRHYGQIRENQLEIQHTENTRFYTFLKKSVGVMYDTAEELEVVLFKRPECIDTAITRLTLSEAADSDSPIIQEIEKLKHTFCQNYLNKLEQEKEIPKVQSQKAALEAAQLAEVQQKQQGVRDEFHKNGSFGPSESHGEQTIEAVDIRLSDNEEYDLDPNYKYALHESVFNADPRRLSHLLLKGCDVNTKDQHGNTPLHLAVMLGRESCIDILVKSGASVRSKNLAGWNPVEEAVSFGNKDIIKLLWTQHNLQLQHDLVERRKLLIHQLDKIDDFYMELAWEIITSVPLVSRFGVLPSDLCKIYKQGRSIRVDSTFFNYDKIRIIRSDTSVLFDGSDPEKPALYYIDHADKDYSAVGDQPKTAEEIKEEVDKKMCKDIASFDIPTESITFERAKSGLFFNKKVKSEMVGSFTADFYTVKGLQLVSRKRREHLSKIQIRKNDANSIVSILAGISLPFKYPYKEYDIHDSLPPPECEVTWQQYITSNPGECPVLARKLKIKEQVIPYDGELGMTPEFPISIQLFTDMLEIVAPFKQFSHLREFMNAKMPPGFPVKFEIPLLLTFSAKYEILKFEFKIHEEDVCKIPKDYTNFPHRTELVYFF